MTQRYASTLGGSCRAGTALLLLWSAGCGSGSPARVSTITEPPTFSPTPGRFPAVVLSVRVRSTASEASIYYTTDGSAPSETSLRYVGPIEIATTTTLRAVAVRPGFESSPPVSGTYDLVHDGIVLTGPTTYAGRPLGTLTQVAPTFWCRDEDSGKMIDGLLTYYDPETSAYAVGGLAPRRSGCGANVHVAGAQSTLPGNYESFRIIDLRNDATDGQHAFEFDVERILHLVSPYDNNTILMDIEQYPQQASPVHFEWESLAEAATYDVWLYDCSNPPGYSCGSIRHSTTAATVFDATLNPSAGGRHYEFTVYAHDASGREVGFYTTTYRNGYGWDYRFTVP